MKTLKFPLLLAAVLLAVGSPVRAEAPDDDREPPPPRDENRDNPPPPRDDENRPAPKRGEKSGKSTKGGKGGERSSKQGGERGGKQGGRKADGSDPQAYTLTQAMSDKAQLHTIAFNGLAFLTGEFGADTFIPPGKVCDYFGFQYMRDIDAAKKGHNPVFLNRVSGNVLKTLTEAQRATFAARAQTEAVELEALAQRRFPIIKAFHRQMTGDIPAGSAGLNKAAVVKAVGDLFAADAEISYARAVMFGGIVSSFSPEQKAYFAKMKFGDFNTWPDVDVSPYKMPRGTPKLVNVAYMTYASEMFSWFAGSVDADVYFCPERHGTYFGGFYMKDMPAMGKKDYDISTSVTGDSGADFLAALTDKQRAAMLAIPDLQRKALAEVATVRKAVAVELRKALTGGVPDKARVVALGRRYGELDGEMSYYYASAFATVNRTLTADQRAKLMKIRNLEGYECAPAYIYSAKMETAPVIPNTDAFFFPPKAN